MAMTHVRPAARINCLWLGPDPVLYSPSETGDSSRGTLRAARDLSSIVPRRPWFLFADL